MAALCTAIPRVAAILLAALVVTGCSSETVLVDGAPAPIAPPVAAEIEVEVYDPLSGYVWEDVGVRVVDAWTEFAGQRIRSNRLDLYVLSDANGLAYLSPFTLAQYGVGFPIDVTGRAVLPSSFAQDEAIVLIEVFAPGFTSQFVEVPLSWDEPYRFVSVPF